MAKVKYLVSIALGLIMAYFEQYFLLYGFLLAIVLLDLITGCMAAIITGGGLEGKTALKGVFKKLALFIALGFGTFLDVFIPFAAQKVSVDLPDTLIFSAIICVYIVVCECISICENLYRVSPNILPGWVLKILGEFKEQIDSKNEK